MSLPARVAFGQYARAEEETIAGTVAAYLAARFEADSSRAVTFADYALLLLEWEAAYPDDWRAASASGSPWNLMEQVLRDLGRHGSSAERFTEQIQGLVVAAVLREYRYKDWRFASVARTVSDEMFKARVRRLCEPDEFTQRLAQVGAEVVSLRAKFLLFLIDNPNVAIKWQSWARAGATRRWASSTTAKR